MVMPGKNALFERIYRFAENPKPGEHDFMLILGLANASGAVKLRR